MYRSSKRAAAGLLLLVSAACGGEGGGGTPPTEPGATGEFVMNIARAANSTIPAEADSALVRIWRGTTVNALKAVAIPAPGATTQVQFNLPAADGYSVGVVAYRFNSNSIGREGFAAGVTHNVTILADQANQAAVNVAPVTLTRTGADTLRAGSTVTETYTFSNPALATSEMLGENAYVRVRATPWTSDSEFVQTVVGVPNGTGFTASVTVPAFDADSALYLQPLLSTSASWPVEGRPVRFFVPSTNRGQPLIRLPAKPASGSITIVFDRSAK